MLSFVITIQVKLITLKDADSYLKSGITLKQLEAFANEMTDNEAAEQLATARRTLFKTLNEQEQKRA
jgi:hypothetical protein